MNSLSAKTEAGKSRGAWIGIVLGVVIGLAIGVDTFTFVYAKGYSYLTNDPASCANCHVMTQHFEGWLKSSHRSVASCNDCHTPDGFLSKYVTKASNGFWHSFAFTTGNFPDPISIKPHNLEVVQQACRKCHQDIVQAIEGWQPDSPALSCLPCHQSVGHLE